MTTLALLSENKKISKEEAKAMIDTYTNKPFSIISANHIAYLCGYTLESRNKTEAEIAQEIEERERKHKKAVKFAKKKKLSEPEMDTTPVETVVFELNNHPFGRDLKDGFVPDMSVYLTFSKMMEELQSYQVFNVELRGKTGNKQEADERKLMSLLDPVYRHQGHVVRAWHEIKIDYQLASNDVIFKETLKDFANFFAYLTEYQKLATKLLKQEPRLKDLYDVIFKPFNPKANLFAIALEEAFTLCSGNKTHSTVPADLTESKKLFWDAFKESTKEAKDFFK